MRLPRYTKALAATIGAFAGVLGTVALDDAVTLDEFGVAAAAVVALVSGLVTAFSPKNRED